MASRNCKINGVKLAKRERVVANRGNHKADRRGITSSTWSPLEDAAQSVGTRCSYSMALEDVTVEWAPKMARMNQLMRCLLPARQWTQWRNKEQQQQQVKCPGRIHQSQRTPWRTYRHFTLAWFVLHELLMLRLFKQLRLSTSPARGVREMEIEHGHAHCCPVTWPSHLELGPINWLAFPRGSCKLNWVTRTGKGRT